MSVRIINADVSQRTARGQFMRGTHWRPRKPHWDREWLLREYVDRKRSASDIAGEMGCVENNILFWLKKHGIPTRTISEARQVKRWGVSGRSNPMYGKLGALNPRYVDGSSPERQRSYAQSEGRAFLKAVYSRDGYSCRRCSAPKKGHRSIQVHHIKPWAGNPALRFDFANVVTLCRSCHCWVHSRANTLKEWVA